MKAARNGNIQLVNVLLHLNVTLNVQDIWGTSELVFGMLF